MRKTPPTGAMTVGEFVTRSLRLVGDFYASLDTLPPRTGLVVSTSPKPLPTTPGGGRALGLMIPSLIAGAVQVVTMVREAQKRASVELPWLASLDSTLESLHSALRELVMGDDRARRLWSLVDLVMTTTRGIVADGLAPRPTRLRRHQRRGLPGLDRPARSVSRPPSTRRWFGACTT